MAGYLMTMDSVESIEKCIQKGIYTTRVQQPNKFWSIAAEATIADYATMKEGDNIFFFHSRKIYGFGELINISGNCVFNNFKDAMSPKTFNDEDIQNPLIKPDNECTGNYRWLCTFKPSKFFFKNGIDMDDMLLSSPSRFKMIRALWKRSFIKFSEDENLAMKDIFLRRGSNNLTNFNEEAHFPFYEKHHKLIKKYIKENSEHYHFDIKPIVDICRTEKDGSIGHEMALEALLLDNLKRGADNVSLFGRWDYLSHQVIASPFKAIDYMDRMDIFGYSLVTGYSTVDKYLIIEVKKGESSLNDIQQLMKYVDWVCNEYTNGDYSRIVAYLVAFNYSDDCKNMQQKDICKRIFTIGARPARTEHWNHIKLLQYKYENQKLTFEEFK